MISHTTGKFRKAFQALPPPIQRRAQEAYSLWKQDPFNPVLHFKQVHKTKPVHSIRIAIGWRSLGIKRGERLIWFWIGSHADYDNLISKL